MSDPNKNSLYIPIVTTPEYQAKHSTKSRFKSIFYFWKLPSHNNNNKRRSGLLN